MSFEDKKAELGVLFTRMQNEPEDWGELYQLNELKAFGMPLPQDLVEFERDLEAEFAADAEKRSRSADPSTNDDHARLAPNTLSSRSESRISVLVSRS